MTWFKSDDTFWRHPKVRRLGKDRLPAVGLWELAGTWCADNIVTNVADGFTPDEQVEQWDPKHRYAKRLVDVTLWERTEIDGESGYLFHDWADYNPTRAEVEAEREEWRKKKALQRKGRRTSTVSREVSPGDISGDSDGESPESPGSRSRPRSRPLGGAVGEGGAALDSAGSNEPPPPRCPEHLNEPTTAPCGKCGDARRANQAWHADQETRRLELAAALDAARVDPRMRCGHGTDGGRYIHPVTGKSATCAHCRTESTRDTG